MHALRVILGDSLVFAFVNVLAPNECADRHDASLYVLILADSRSDLRLDFPTAELHFSGFQNVLGGPIFTN
jgi:hypothetical protein